MEGVRKVNVNFTLEKAQIEYDSRRVDIEDLKKVKSLRFKLGVVTMALSSASVLLYSLSLKRFEFYRYLSLPRVIFIGTLP